MSSSNLFPSLSFEQVSPRAFIHEVIGNSELSTIRLPAATSDFAGPNQCLGLLIRLKWILRSWLRISITKECTIGTESTFEDNRDLLLRVLTYACDIAGSILPDDKDWSIEYITLRRTILQLLTYAVSLFSRLEISLSEEQVDWLRNQIDDMVQAWSKKSSLSFGEASLIREVLAFIASLSSQNECQIFLTAIPDEVRVINASFDNLLALSPAPHINQSGSFWTIHNWLAIQDYTEPASGLTPRVVVAYREALGKFRARPDLQYSFPLATYVMEETALQVSSAYQLLPHEEMASTNQPLSNMLQISNKEAIMFNNYFPRHVRIFQAQPVVTMEERSFRSMSQPSSPPPAIPSRSGNRLLTQPIARKAISDQNILSVSPITPVYTPSLDLSIATTPIIDDIRAYQWSEPVELPTRKQTRKEVHRPGHFPTIPVETHRNLEVVEEIHGGLEVVDETQFGASPDYSELMRPSQLEPRRPSNVQDYDTVFTGRPPSIGTVSSRNKSSLFGRLRSSKKASLVPLPASLEFCFSSCAKQMLFWCKKNPDSIVQMQYPSLEAKRFELVMPDAPLLPQTKAPTCSIRLLAAIHNLAMALVHVEENRWLYVLRGLSFHPIVAIPSSIPAILHLALSDDGETIAMGCGQYILCYRYEGQRIIGSWKLDLNLGLGGRVVRLQKINFSPDSRRIVSALQVEHSVYKHAVHVSVWDCSAQVFRLAAQLDPVYITVGYADDTGISAIFLTGPSDTLAVQQAFLTAALSKSYPSILPISSGMRNQHLDLADKRIESASQCPLLAYPHLCAMRSGRNKIFLVDTRTGIVDKVADFTAERKGLYLRHENFILAIQGPDVVCALWRTADENLTLKTIVKDEHGKWVANTTELGMIYRQAASLF